MTTLSDPRPEQEGFSFVGKPPNYHSYLLRFWEEHSDELPLTVWRFSLEDPLTDQRYGFASLEALVDWLKGKLRTSEV
jgi:hypothetical protein